MLTDISYVKEGEKHIGLIDELHEWLIDYLK